MGSSILTGVLVLCFAPTQERIAEDPRGIGADHFPVVFDAVGSGVFSGSYVPAFGMGAGVAAADYDDDGDVDLFVPSGRLDRLYRNTGSDFEEIASDVGLASNVEFRTALWFDRDGDGDLDLLRGSDDPDELSSFRLDEQVVGGGFQDVTAPAGLFYYAVDSAGTTRGGTCAVDLDNDGFLDLYAAAWLGFSLLYTNQQDGSFADVTQTSGVRMFEHQWQPVTLDVDEDGWFDLYVAVDFGPNHLWVNQHDGTFVDRAAEAGVDIVMNDMGAYVIDYDNDGDLDLYTTNIEDHDEEGVLYKYNALLENRSTEVVLEFEDVSKAVGVGAGNWGWGIAIFDADNDGLVEFAATNGFWGSPWDQDRSKLWTRLDPVDPHYTEVGRIAGFDDHYWGSSLLSIDFDRDGDRDLVQSCMEGVVRLLENTHHAPIGHSLTVRPRMAGTNQRAIGAIVRVTGGGIEQARTISAGTSFLGQEPAEAHFGLGAATLADSVRVEFPDGTVTELTNVAADQVVTIWSP